MAEKITSDMNPILPSMSIADDIREKPILDPNQGLPSQNKQSSDFIGYGVLPGALKSDTLKIGKI